MNFENSKTSDPHTLLLNLTDKINLKNKNNKFKISVPTSNEGFELPDGSYSISDIQDYLEYILKRRGEKTFNPSIRIYINKIENRIMFSSWALYTFAPNKLFGQLLDISPNNFIFLKAFGANFFGSYIEVWFTDQNSRPLEIEDKINVTLVIN